MLRTSVVTRFVRVLSNNRSHLCFTNNLFRGIASCAGYEFETLHVTVPLEYVYHVEINRPEKRNAMNKAFWSDMLTCFNKISLDGDCRSVVLSGAGKIFSSGIDLQYLIGDMAGFGGETDVARRAFFLRNFIPMLQGSLTVVEKCSKPVIAAVHSACIGAGVDLVCACDIRYCSQDAWFQIKEVDIGIVADLGTLQRLPKIVGSDSLARELCYTARQMKSDEALNVGFVSRVVPDKDDMVAAALETAKFIASKSPVAVQGTKLALLYARDHSVSDGLEQVATLNQSLLQGEDVVKAAMAAVSKESVTFSKL